MHPRLPLLALSSVLCLGAAACGDDRNESTGTDTDPTSTTTATSTSTTDDLPTTTVDTSTTDDTTGTSTTTGEEESTTTVDPSTTTGVQDCAAPADDADEDGDAVANKDDNCRCDANPNQLDFDGNQVGNVCDAPLSFTVVDGVPPDFNKLDTTARAEQQGAFCEFPVSMIITGGDVEVQLDDAGTGHVWLKRLAFADTPEQTCDIKLGGIVSVVTLKLLIKTFFGEGPDMFTVGFPFQTTDHAMGMVTGMMDMAHKLLISGIIEITESSNEELAPKGEQTLDKLEGNFAAGAVTVTEQGKSLDVVFDNGNAVIFDQTTMSGIQVTMTGLEGTLRLSK